MTWQVKCLRDFKLYAVTDIREYDLKIIRQIEQALIGGTDVIQLRSKMLSDVELLDLAKRIYKITRKLKKLFMMNDRVDLALAAGADGVHIGQEDLPIHTVRKLMGNQRKIIGVSTRNIKQAIAAEAAGADYIGFGPLFGTPTKPGYQPAGLRQIHEVVNRVRIPVVCIGGINLQNVDTVLEAGANRIAVVRAIFSAKNPRAAAEKLRAKLDNLASSYCHSRMFSLGKKGPAPAFPG
ncbi:MAG: thiamine-phosphate diphosphorylase [Omnitrophica bacterium RIFCSPLOWO2_12_FULL_44_17]|uniref:Thiamine-phosphate synthase n=1 Tax=Candidatus Danuiimicrobium aquiferis TaxID=1801832 RepID=A0A1G1L2S5_9BACT|nr:MAG: thiamine-phosphate diphosphorylase [Omnitrophica bacterium RIFCSPHIGHO2_02_FULL_45_28]OGW89775.1 MAG: thiamine-phosphate diphosphorylase [Omnitrophica bacterium RIFCSPHIGHO2_12_FULL_44_12]OGW99418.1 MAG: thiamine-phosphate diphosphorylase [Omnitrophica bacterium RIFCSPLOWO2_12_FULL_44_17]OGX03030.1 MAG: thiamine-phosphate diphosphorylase [Omnitrophica bacterium RIFCSPLOWO2_02_FULL_44_11]